MHDSQRFKDIADFDNTASDMWRNSAYRSREIEEWFVKNMFTPHIHRKKPKGKPMPAATACTNSRKSSVWAPVERAFAHQKNRFGLFIRMIGLARA